MKGWGGRWFGLLLRILMGDGGFGDGGVDRWDVSLRRVDELSV